MVKEITRKELKAKIDRGTTSTSWRRSRGGSLRCREHKTPFLSGMCNLLQPSATINRTLVAGAGKRFESARRLSYFPRFAGKTLEQ